MSDASGSDTFAWYQSYAGLRTCLWVRNSPMPGSSMDIYGNVWECCQDWYAPYSAEHSQDPQGPFRGHTRVMRGGSWFCQPKTLRQVARGYMTPETRVFLTEFRLVMEADD